MSKPNTTLLKTARAPTELFRVNFAVDDDDKYPDENDPSLYDGPEPDEVLEIGDK